MTKHATVMRAAALASCLCAIAPGSQIGRPVSLDITIDQGSSNVITATNVPVSSLDPLDGKTYIKLGDFDGGSSSIYLSIWMQNPSANEGLMSFYVRSADPLNPNIPGAPLFDLNGSGMINVSVDHLRFQVGSAESDVSVAQFSSPLGDTMSSVYMMDQNGWYYLLPGAETVWLGPKQTHQVPYSDFKDANPAQYDFKNGSGTDISIGWYNMFSPVDATYQKVLSDPPYTLETDPTHGSVFEIGLDAFAWRNGTDVPEPASAALVFLGAILTPVRRYSEWFKKPK
jgi:hypothetical protein